MDTNSASSDQAILELKHQWDQLSDIDRARRVVQIKRSSDLSFREIATLLGCNESSLRHIRRGLLAPPADIAAAQEGKISTNQLVDRADAELQRQGELRKADAKRLRERQVLPAALCDLIQALPSDTSKSAITNSQTSLRLSAQARSPTRTALADSKAAAVDPESK